MNNYLITIVIGTLIFLVVAVDYILKNNTKNKFLYITLLFGVTSIIGFSGYNFLVKDKILNTSENEEAMKTKDSINNSTDGLEDLIVDNQDINTQDDNLVKKNSKTDKDSKLLKKLVDEYIYFAQELADQKKYLQAIFKLNDALELDSKNGQCLRMKAYFYSELKNFKEALEVTEKIFQIFGEGNSNDYWNRAVYKSKLGIEHCKDRILAIENCKLEIEGAIKSNDKFLNIDQPSLFVINQLKDDLSKTHTCMQRWVIDESRPDEQFKLDAEILLDQTIQNDLDTIEKLSFKWTQESGGVEEFNSISSEVSSLIDGYNSQVRNVLVDINSYQDAFFVMEAQTNFEEINLHYEGILNSINKLTQKRTEIAKRQYGESHFNVDHYRNMLEFYKKNYKLACE